MGRTAVFACSPDVALPLEMIHGFLLSWPGGRRGRFACLLPTPRSLDDSPQYQRHASYGVATRRSLHEDHRPTS